MPSPPSHVWFGPYTPHDGYVQTGVTVPDARRMLFDACAISSLP